MLTHHNLTKIGAGGELASTRLDQQDKNYLQRNAKIMVISLRRTHVTNHPFLLTGVSYAFFSHNPTFYSFCKGTEDYKQRA